MQDLMTQIRSLAAGTICSIAREQAIFSQMECGQFENSDRIHDAFIAFAHQRKDEFATWQDAWQAFMNFAESEEAYNRMLDLLEKEGSQLVSVGQICTWKDSDGQRMMLDRSTCVIAKSGKTEPFIIQEGFF